MNTLAVEMNIDEENHYLKLNFEGNDEIKIGTSGDVDLSEYIKKLTHLIDNKKKIILDKPEFENPKLQLIQKTIDEITNSFNESIEGEKDSSDDTNESENK
ncbi:hypothetical protein [Desulfobacula sp.]|uniref:hypothetical protein n=1 Tax=Desulfobacula sp. TaxID=2593537 RepID=UPI0025B8829C|nr:hypothetical protein [Desulfobacula sp.]MBC2705138.1 hypothetical protein [Desulfobacula sp.]